MSNFCVDDQDLYLVNEPCVLCGRVCHNLYGTASRRYGGEEVALCGDCLKTLNGSDDDPLGVYLAGKFLVRAAGERAREGR